MKVKLKMVVVVVVVAEMMVVVLKVGGRSKNADNYPHPPPYLIYHLKVLLLTLERSNVARRGHRDGQTD
jgi:hypothetical protein